MKKHHFSNFLKRGLWLFLAWLIVRSFIVQVGYVPSDSMEGTLKKGSFIVIDKMAYGARLPITPLSLYFLHIPRAIHSVQWLYRRLPGYRAVKRGDILVFNQVKHNETPIDLKPLFVKRCVAVAGDTLVMAHGELFVNGIKHDAPKKSLFPYNVYQNFGQSYRFVKDTLLNTTQAQKIIQEKGEMALKRRISNKAHYSPVYFPHQPRIKWNLDFFGPLYVPKAGDTLILNLNNYYLYKSLLEQHEGVSISTKNNRFYIDGEERSHYAFGQNYYFVLGDNRSNSIDSRYWGLLPESHVVGRLLFHHLYN